MSKKLKKIVVILLLSIIFISNALNVVKAAMEIPNAYIEKIGEAEFHLKYYKEEKGMSTYATCSIVGYKKDGNFYPAYCLNRDLHGVGAVDNYMVDVDSIVDNNQIWRAVKNGYPYKTAEEMGLNSEFDAFAVTKFAIYCLTGQAELELYSADENDEEGQAMLNALRNLVYIGQNGNERYDENIQIEQMSDYIDDGEYYSILFKVISDASISKYNIKNVQGTIDGDLITDENENVKNTFSEGENFKLKILKSHCTSNKEISIDVEGVLKSYPMFYGKTRIEGTQNYLLTASSYENKVASTKINIKKYTGKIIVNKVDSETNNPIEGVTFELYNKENMKSLGKYITDANGKIEINNLCTGNYLLKEVNTDKWYKLAEDMEINVKEDETTYITVENELKKGQIKVIKVDSKNNEVKLENIEFDVLDEFGNLVEKLITNKDGEATTKMLPINKNYLIKETKTNEKYVLSEEIKKVTLEQDKITNIIFENEKITGKIKIVKTSEDDNKNLNIKKGDPLEGIKFNIYDEKDNIIDTVSTNKDGVAFTKELEKGKYKVKEIETNKWYLLNEENKNVEIKEKNEIITLNMENKSVNVDEKIEKIGPNVVSPKDTIEYEINVENNSNVGLKEFVWEDIIPTNYIELTKMKLGNFNMEGTYDVYYKTNLTENYILLLEDVSTLTQEEIDFSNDLTENEYITNIKLDFGHVEEGFKANNKTKIIAKVNSKLKHGDVFENKVKLTSNYNEKSFEKESKCETMVYKILPNTGM